MVFHSAFSFPFFCSQGCIFHPEACYSFISPRIPSSWSLISFVPDLGSTSCTSSEFWYCFHIASGKSSQKRKDVGTAELQIWTSPLPLNCLWIGWVVAWQHSDLSQSLGLQYLNHIQIHREKCGCVCMYMHVCVCVHTCAHKHAFRAFSRLPAFPPPLGYSL